MAGTNVPTPADAVATFEWEDDGFRQFKGSSWRVPFTGDVDLFGTGRDITIYIWGHQFPDGRCNRWVVADQIHGDIPPTTLRMLAESFSDACAEIERFNNTASFSAAR